MHPTLDLQSAHSSDIDNHMAFDIPSSRVSGIYCAIHKSTSLCYVGSSINIRKRLKEHFYKAFRRGSVNRFHVMLRQFGIDAFDFSVVEECDESALLEREKFYISFFDSASLDGFNSRPNPTANYDYVASEVTRARISRSKKGRKPTPQQIQNQIVGQTGLRKSIETRNKISMANKGKVFSREHRSRISAARIGRPLSAETRAKQSASLMGHSYSPESISKRHETIRLKRAEMAAVSLVYSDIRKAVVILDSRGQFVAWYPSVLEAAKEHNCPRYYLGIEKPNRDGLWFYYATAIYHPMPLSPV